MWNHPPWQGVTQCAVCTHRPGILLIGGGGCGKTTMLLDVVSHTFETFFERVVRATPSNRAARFFGAKTVHSLSGLRPHDSLRTASLRIRSDAVRKKMDAVQLRTGALLVDEFSQLQAQLWQALCLLFTIVWSAALQSGFAGLCETRTNRRPHL